MDDEKEKNKILILHAVVDADGGIGTVIANLIKYQVAKGYKVGIIYTTYYSNIFDELKDIGVQWYPIDKNKLIGGHMIWGMKLNSVYKLAKTQYPDKQIIIHAHNTASIGILCNVKSINLVCTIHGISRNGISSLRGNISNIAYKLILKKLAKHKKKICGVSENTCRYYQNYIPNYEIISVKNGIRLKEKQNSEKMKERNKFVIGHVGDISYSKGWDTTFNAYKDLEMEYQEKMVFNFAGKLVDIDEQEIESLIKSNGLAGKVKYLGKVKDAANTVIPTLDVLVLASISEGMPMVILECMAQGVPVITTDVGGIGEVIKHGNNGFLVKKESEEIKKYIKELYNNRELYNKMRDNAIKSYRESFTIDHMGESYEKIYKGIK